MPITTFLHAEDCLAPLGNSSEALEIDDLLDKVRASTGRDWRVRAVIITPTWYRNRRTKIKYEVFCGIGTGMLGFEFQIINFWSGTEVSAEVVQAFFYGVLSGARK